MEWKWEAMCISETLEFLFFAVIVIITITTIITIHQSKYLKLTYALAVFSSVSIFEGAYIGELLRLCTSKFHISSFVFVYFFGPLFVS